MTDGPPDVTAALQQLAELHRQGALTDEAYAQAQTDLLRRAGTPPPQQSWTGGPQAGWGGQPVWGEQPTQFTGGQPTWGEQPTQFFGGGVPPGAPAAGYGLPGAYYPQQPYPPQQFAGSWGATPPYPPYPPQQQPRRSRTALIALAAVLVLVVGSVLVYTQVLRGEIILEPAATAGQDPFTATTVSTPHMSVTPERRFVPAVPAGGGVPSVVGTDVGLYGDFKGRSGCDREQMITFLTADPTKGTAWANVQGIALADLPEYVRALTPAVLRQDTRVTNHGFAGGRATPRQAVFEAGTRVLVDQFGVPRAKCGCGNPLAEAMPSSSLGYGYSGEEWPEFAEDRLLAIARSAAAVEVLTMTDFDTGNQFDRPVGSDGASDAGTGQVQVRLTWRGRADLDVAVTEPGGTLVWYNARSSTSGGVLDVDANSNCLGATSDTQVNIENVFWPTGQAPVGTYQVQVTLYNACGATSTDFQLRASVGGRAVVDRSGTGSAATTVSFSYNG